MRQAASIRLCHMYLLLNVTAATPTESFCSSPYNLMAWSRSVAAKAWTKAAIARAWGNTAFLFLHAKALSASPLACENVCDVERTVQNVGVVYAQVLCLCKDRSKFWGDVEIVIASNGYPWSLVVNKVFAWDNRCSASSHVCQGHTTGCTCYLQW